MAAWIDPAEAAYNLIRASLTDVREIARRTGYKSRNIEKVKQHLFFKIHLLDRYAAYGQPARRARFDSDAAIAAVWRRLEAGNFTEADRQLLRHEIAEAWYMRNVAESYDKAHNAATKRFPAVEFG